MTTLRSALPLLTLGCGGGSYLTVERILLESRGVLAASVNPLTEMAYIEYDPEVTDPDTLLGALKRAGYAPAVRVTERGSRQPISGRRRQP
jgi:hypothetical protein